MSKYIEINGRKYNQETGLPLEMEYNSRDSNICNGAKNKKSKISHAKNYCATDIHGHMQKSQTLSRKYTKPSADFVRKKKIRQIIRQNIEASKNSIYEKDPSKIRQVAPFNFNILKNSRSTRNKTTSKFKNNINLSDKKFLQKEAPFNYSVLNDIKKSEQENKIKQSTITTEELRKAAPFNYEAIRSLKPKNIDREKKEVLTTKKEIKSEPKAQNIIKKPLSQNNTQKLNNNIKTTKPVVNIQKRPIAVHRTKTESLGSSARANQIIARRNRKVINSIQPMQRKINDFQPAKASQSLNNKTNDFHIPNPAEKRAHHIQAQRKLQKAQPVEKRQHTPSSVIKNNAIADALSNAPKHNSNKKHKNKSMFKLNKFVGFASGFAALILFAGYVTYLNMPDISVKIAAAQAGIDARYPGYKPSGYKLDGPIAYNDGQVKIKFQSISGDKSYIVNQTKSGWDSKALLENYIKEKSDNEYATTREKGITVYTYDNGKAAWVSGGILYTIDGNAPLSPGQIRKIATSAV